MIELSKLRPMAPHEVRAKFSQRNPSVLHVLQFFADSHEHPEIQENVTQPMMKIAFWMVETVPDGQELTVALRALYDAREAFIRQFVIASNFTLRRPTSLADAPRNPS